MPFTLPTTAASKANTGYGATLYLGTTASPPVYGASPFAELKTFRIAPISVPDVETTTLLSPLNTEEMIPGMIKPGTIELSGNFIGDATQLAITTDAQAQASFSWKAVAPIQQGAKTYTANGIGYFTKYEVGPFEKNKPIEFSASIQITGPYYESVA